LAELRLQNQTTTTTNKGRGIMAQQHWTVVADGQETGVFVTDYELVLGLAEEYLSLGAEDVQIVEVN